MPTFRLAVDGDDEALTAVERAASMRALGHVFPPQEHPYPTADVRERWRGLLRDQEVRVGIAEDRAGPAACVAVDDEVLRHLAVRPDRWGTGVARAALEWAGRNATVTRLWCLEENHRALGFYRHLGWTPSGRRQRAEFPPFPAEVELVLLGPDRS